MIAIPPLNREWQAVAEQPMQSVIDTITALPWNPFLILTFNDLIELKRCSG